MEGWLSDIVNWMEALSPLWAYAVILLIAYGENVVPPIPGDMVIVFGGYLVGRGQLDFVIVVGLATLGGALGFMTMYALGRRLGYAVLNSPRWRWLPTDRVAKAQSWIRRWGYWIVTANRFLSGARSVIALTVGMARMQAGKTAACATLAAAIWTVLVTFAGYKVGENWEVVADYLRRYGQVILALLVLFAAVQVLRWYRKRRAKQAAEPYREP